MHRLTTIAALAALLPTTAALADWPDDPALNQLIGGGGSEQVQSKVVAHPGGGVYISWYDNAAGGYDVRLQRLDAAGNELWAPGGVLVADRSFSSTQDYGLAVAADGAALLAFRDDRTGSTQVTAARITCDGAAAWGAMGVQMTNGSSFYAAPKITGTSDGEIVVAWTRDSAVDLQRLDVDGDPLWEGGVTLDDGSAQYLLSDLHGGSAGAAIVSWVRQTSFQAPKHIYAQKLDGDGASQWGAGHVAVFDSGSLQFGNFPTFVTDGAGGAVFGWYSSSPSLQCWAQHILSDGTEAFGHGGMAASTNAARLRVAPSVMWDGTNVVLYYEEISLNQADSGVYGQRFGAKGSRLWTDAGREIVPVTSTQINQIRALADTATEATEGDAGSTVAYVRTISFDNEEVVAQRLDSDGMPVWESGEADISIVGSGKSRLAAARTTGGDAVLSWTDSRSDAGDLFAQNLSAAGEPGSIVVPGDANGDGVADVTDLLLVLDGWGPCTDPCGCAADLDGNGQIDVNDLLAVLAGWS